MRKRLAALAAGIGLAGALLPLGATPAHAAECIGSPAIPESYVCIIRREVGRITVTPGPIVRTVPFCALVLCVEEQGIPLIDIEIDDSEVVVLYYMGKCYYVSNGTVTTDTPTATSPPDCP